MKRLFAFACAGSSAGLHTIAMLATIATMIQPALVRAGDGGKSETSVLRRPLSKVEALNIAIAKNGIILQAEKDVEAAEGVSIQAKAIILPQVVNSAGYGVRQDSGIEANEHPQVNELALPGLGVLQLGDTSPTANNQAWSADIRIVQSIYEGGRMRAALKTSKLINEQALLVFQATVADVLQSVSIAYDDVLRAAKQIEVREASVKFLTEYLNQTKIKNAAGALPEFDVLRQEVEVANAESQRVRALGNYWVAKQTFVQLLGYDLPTTIGDDLPLKLTTPLVAVPYRQSLDAALSEALIQRTEIEALAKEELLRDQSIISAKAGLKPSVQAFAGYEVTSRQRSRNAGDAVHGALAGVQMSWPIFDGFLTKGRVAEAEALRGRATQAKLETTRIVQLQVRTAWSDLRTARSVLNAQSKNVEKAIRAQELAQTRYNEGAGTQIDVLNAQTAVTEARGFFVDALRDYSVARTRLVRATGTDLAEKKR